MLKSFNIFFIFGLKIMFWETGKVYVESQGRNLGE